MLNAGQQVVKIVHDELVAMLGGDRHSSSSSAQADRSSCSSACRARARRRPPPSSRCGSARTASKPLLVAADVYRPAAVDQLGQLGDQVGVEVHSRPVGTPAWRSPAPASRSHASRGIDVMILDTAGRLHVDEPMMDELVRISGAVTPAETLLVVDAMTGQEAVKVAEAFHAAPAADRRSCSPRWTATRAAAPRSASGASPACRSRSSAPASVPMASSRSTRTASPSASWAWATSSPSSSASRRTSTQEEAERVAQRMMEQRFTLDDFRSQLTQIKKMGPIGQVLSA